MSQDTLLLRPNAFAAARANTRLRCGPVWLLTAIGCLLLSWLIPATRLYWNRLDSLVFHSLNGTLAWHPAWQWFWSILNTRWFDLVAGVVILGLLADYFRTLTPTQRKRTVVSLLVTFSLGVVWRGIVSDGIIEGVLHYHRPSPTALHTLTIRLSELYPGLDPKDISPWCFPSDHGFVLLMLVGYFALHYDRRTLRRFVLLAFCLSFPRLVSGAHWVTDILVGSGVIAMSFLATFLATPAHDWCVARVEQLVTRRKPRAASGADRHDLRRAA